MLNTKYKDLKADMILTMGGGALNLLREEIFNESSIFYKVPILFVAVLSKITLQEKEQDYITGIYSINNSTKVIELILCNHKKIERINVLLGHGERHELAGDDRIFKSTKSIFLKRVDIKYMNYEFIEDILLTN